MQLKLYQRTLLVVRTRAWNFDYYNNYYYCLRNKYCIGTVTKQIRFTITNVAFAISRTKTF